MKLQSVLPKRQQNVYIPKYNFKSTHDSVSFSGCNKEDDNYYDAKKYALRIKLYKHFIPCELKNFNLDKLDGIQKGIKVFDGLTMKDISFMFHELDSIAVKRGCSNQCLHCYANAMPAGKEEENSINKMPFEDYKAITDGLKELKSRIGISPISAKTYPVLFYDSDCMETTLYDKNGKEHDFTELCDMFYEATDHQTVFDTVGWHYKSPKMQERAEKYVNYLRNNEHKFYQINISLNPFNKIYAKALELGFNPNTYYISKENNTPENAQIAKGKALYDSYILRMANVLYTFTPLLNNNNFSIIERPVENSQVKMKNFTEDEFKVTTNHILQKLHSLYEADLSGEQKYIKSNAQLKSNINEYSRIINNKIDTDLMMSGRLLELYKERKVFSSQKDIEKAHKSIKRSNENYERIKICNRLDASDTNYIKIIDANGDLYMYDGYNTIPTEIALNISTKNQKTPELYPKPKRDFIVTRDIINKSRS